MSQHSSSWLHHPEHGELPASRLIECVFALAPSGRILHYHLEQVTQETRGEERHYVLNGAAAAEERARCQVIPPFVTTFKSRTAGGG